MRKYTARLVRDSSTGHGMRSSSVGTASAYQKAGGEIQSHMAVQYVTVLIFNHDVYKIYYITLYKTLNQSNILKKMVLIGF